MTTVSESGLYKLVMRSDKPIDKNNDAMTELFDFMGHKVRVVVIEGEPWFVAQDVVTLLGLSSYADGSPNVTDATRGLVKGEKNLLRRTTPHLMPGSVEILFSYRQPSLLAISESGLYKLVLKSRKPVAKKFQDWVTGTVLPAIRKDGMYVRGEEKGYMIIYNPSRLYLA